MFRRYQSSMAGRLTTQNRLFVFRKPLPAPMDFWAKYIYDNI